VFYAALADGGLGLVLGGKGIVRVAGQADDVLRNTYRMSDDFISSFLRTGQRIDAVVPEEALDEIAEAAADVTRAMDGVDGVRISQGVPERVLPLIEAGMELPEGHYVHWAPIEALDGILGDQIINNAGRPHKGLVWWGTDHTIPIVQGGEGVYVTRNTNPGGGFSVLHGPSPQLENTSMRVGIVLDGNNLDVRYHVPGAWVIKTSDQGGVHTDNIVGLILIPND